MLYASLPLFLTEQLGAPAAIVGSIEGVADALQYTLQGLSDWIADRLRRHKPVALLGYAVAALAKPTIALATRWPLMLSGRVLDRLATGVRSAPRDALVASRLRSSSAAACSDWVASCWPLASQIFAEVIRAGIVWRNRS